MAKKEQNMQPREGMTLEEAKAYRAAQYKPTTLPLSDKEKREKFRIFWAQTKKKYSKSEQLEQILWVFLKATGHDEPENFEAGIRHFGLKK